MMMMGRSVHDKDWCLCCRKSKSELTTHHLTNEFNNELGSNSPFWKTQDVAEAAIKRDQEIASYQAEGKTEKQAVDEFKIVGIKDPYIWPFMPMTRHVVPLLHILLGLGNKVMNQF